MKVFELCNNHPVILEYFLMNLLGEIIRKPTELTKMLANTSIENKELLIGKIDECELLDPGNTHIINYCIIGDKIKIKYSDTYILQTFINNKCIWRIQGTAITEILVQNDIQTNNILFDDYKKYLNYVSIEDLSYSNINCNVL